MTPLTLQDVLAHQASVPWPELYQVEQDLLLTLSMRAIFADAFLSRQVAMRGGTVLHKVHLAPAARYSEDIDLVAVGERPENHIRKALMRVLRPVLGKEKSSAIVVQAATGIALASLLGYPLTHGWIFHAIGLFCFAGLCWIPVVGLQLRMRDLARASERDAAPLSERYWHYARVWFWLGVPAFAAVVIVFWLMVSKPQ